MRSPLLLAAIALAGAALTTVPAGAATTPGIDLVVTVRSVETGSVPDDKPPTGPSKGDRILIRDRLLNARAQFGKKTGAAVGTDVGVLTMTSKTAGRVVGVASLPGGRIRFRGVVRFGGASQTLAVDGGTGRYAHARGVLIIGEGDDPLNVYHLKLAPASEGTTV